MEIRYKDLGKNGRLGNQLFQIASTYGIAKYCDKVPVFPKWEYSKYFPNVLPYINENLENNTITGVRVTEEELFYNPEIKNQCDIPVNIDLYGYLQSYNYFNKSDILHLFKFSDEVIDFVTNYKFNIEGELKTIESCEYLNAFHIRRGDYINNENYAKINYINYYLEKGNKYNFFIFSDDKKYINTVFKNLKNVIIVDFVHETIPSEILELCLMTYINSIFLNSNSTFSWWGSFLSKKDSSFFPIKYYDGKLKHYNDKLNQFYPNVNKYINNLDEKIILINTAIIIPVFCDSEDRKNNLNTIIMFLQKYFSVLIIVMEETDNIKHFEYVKKDYGVVYETCNNGYFHRTKMLNDMTGIAYNTYSKSVIVNYDSDVIVNPISLYNSIEKVRYCNKVLAYPYNQNFIRIDKEHNNIAKDNNYDFFEIIKDVEIPNDYVKSLGGVVCFDYDKYLHCGLENENFISFGAEDTERYERVKILNNEESISFEPTPLYHINHFKGINSTTNNPHFLQNKEEYQKVKNMSNEELKEYIKTWNWIL